MPIERLNERESVYVKNMLSERPEIEHNISQLHNAASVTKVFYAAGLAEMMTRGEIGDDVININFVDVQAEGTNVLRDVLKDGGQIRLSTTALLGLMLKYSCNASTDILFHKYFKDRVILDQLMERFNISGSRLYDKNNVWVNEWNLADLVHIFEELYGNRERFGGVGEIVRANLRESRNIYYLFDQLDVEVLGSKTGTVRTDTGVQVNNIGVLSIDNKQYICGAMVERDKISEAVIRIREIGRKIFSEIVLE